MRQEIHRYLKGLKAAQHILIREEDSYATGDPTFEQY